MKIVFVWRFLTPNRGDLSSSPWNYLFFPGGACVKIDISHDLASKEKVSIFNEADLIILGGGGLLGMDKYLPKIDFLANSFGHKLFVWGAGSNWYQPPATLPRLGNVFQVGLRDHPMSESYQEYPEGLAISSSYLPCASALHTYFLAYWAARANFHSGSNVFANDRKASLKILVSVNDAGKAEHGFGSKFFDQLENLLLNYPAFKYQLLGNSRLQIESCLDAIRWADIVVTRSYHCAYWGSLMGKVVLSLPTTSKFRSFSPLATGYHSFGSSDQIIERLPAVFAESLKNDRFHDLANSIAFYRDSLSLNCKAACLAYSKLDLEEYFSMFYEKYSDLLRKDSFAVNRAKSTTEKFANELKSAIIDVSAASRRAGRNFIARD